MNAEIISIGRELLMGETVDTNASFLAKQLPLLGIDLVWVSQVGDIQSQIVEVFRRAWGRSELILTTGGLGPTGDDLTRESVAELMNEKMIVIPELEIALRERFRGFGISEMPVSNLKQCTLIPSAKAINNPNGTAPGWWIEKNGRILICMPGPPREMQEMWNNEVSSLLHKRSEIFILARTWKTFGYTEATIGEMTFPLFPGNNPSLGVYAKPDGIQVQLKVTANTEEKASVLLSEGEKKIEDVLGNSIWGKNDDTLEMAVGRLLVKKGLTLSFIEDYTGGSLTTAFTEVPDNIYFFKGGMVALTDRVKIALGVPGDIITNYGSVSPQLAAAMAEVARKCLEADIGVGITGMDRIARPDGVVYVVINNGKNHEMIVKPRSKQRLHTAVLFELRKILMQF